MTTTPAAPAATDYLDRIGQTAFIVGAGGGIGGAVALRLAARGAQIVCADSKIAAAQTTAAHVQSAGGNALACEVDVTDPASVEAAFDLAVAFGGDVRILVNTAGVQGPVDIRSHEIDVDEFRRVCEVNLFGAVVLTRFFVPHMLPNGNSDARRKSETPRELSTPNPTGSAGYLRMFAGDSR